MASTRGRKANQRRKKGARDRQETSKKPSGPPLALNGSIEWQAGDLSLAIRVMPRAGKDGIQGITDDNRLKIALTAPPVDGAANQNLIKFLSRGFKVGKSHIEIVRGERAREKRIRILAPKRQNVEKFCRRWVLEAPQQEGHV